MDSLLATYASSDEEDEPQQQQPPPPPPSSKASSLFSSLPKAQSSSFFSPLPPPKPSLQTPVSLPTPKLEEHSNPPSKSSALFSLPTLKFQTTPDFHLPPPKKPKKVVQFRPPLPQLSRVDDDDDEEEEEDEEERERKRKRQLGQGTATKSFLSSMPLPKNSAVSTLGSGAASSSVSGRRSIIATEATPTPTPSTSDANAVNNEVGVESGVGNSQENWDYESYGCNHEGGVAGDQSYAGYEGSGSYDSYGNYAQYESGWNDASSGAFAAEASGLSIPDTSSFMNMDRKRRKGQAPMEIIEVKQDELIKNRPREDQSKLTGLAFGPSYQPVPSAKGKISKLAKRKHQIGSLFFDLKQKEMELAERRSKGLLTKAETQAKYGW